MEEREKRLTTGPIVIRFSDEYAAKGDGIIFHLRIPYYIVHLSGEGNLAYVISPIRWDLVKTALDEESVLFAYKQGYLTRQELEDRNSWEEFKRTDS